MSKKNWTARREDGTVLPCRCVLKATTKLIEKAAAEATKKE